MAQIPPIVSTVYPLVPITLEFRDYRRETPALLDTGFTGDLAVPASRLELDLGTPDTSIDWELADGSIVNAPVYLGTFEIIGLPPRSVAITLLGNEYVLGRGVLDRYTVTFDHGQRVLVGP